jgi:hypothetical protein
MQKKINIGFCGISILWLSRRRKEKEADQSSHKSVLLISLKNHQKAKEKSKHLEGKKLGRLISFSGGTQR